MADDYFALQPSGVHNDDSLPKEGSLLAPGDDSPAARTGYVSPLDSPELGRGVKHETKVVSPIKEGARRKRVLSPSELVSVLDRDRDPPPKPDARFLHGGPPLTELDAPSSLAGVAATGKPIATSRWRAFTDTEEAMLQAGWDKLQEERRQNGDQHDKARQDSVKSDREEVQAAVNSDSADPGAQPPHCYPVGLDRLFTVSLTEQILFPAFWQGSAVRVLLAHWFYAPPSTTSSSTASHSLKPYPVDPELSASLDKAYATIRPWEESYEQEMASALKGGVDAQQRLSVTLGGVGNESGNDTGANGSKVEVIFTSENEGRLYSRGFLGSVGKSLWSNGKGLGGGQVVLRGARDSVRALLGESDGRLIPLGAHTGWEAMRLYQERKQGHKKKKSAHALQENSSAVADSDTDSNASPQGRSRHGSSTAPVANKPGATGAGQTDSGFFALLKSKIYGAPTQTDHDADEREQGDSADERANETAEAMAGPRNREGDAGVGDVGEVDELVLVMHGIGQKLASNYESFNFVHAVNQMRKACTTLSTSPQLSPLLHSKRAQFIPVLWRADLQFEDDVDDTRDSADEHLRNRYTLDDIEIKGKIPFLRQVVSGLVLDVPFYLSHHKVKMTKAVVREANRIYRLFCARNPHFAEHGKVSIIAHSLGSALACDILSAQPTIVKPLKDMTRDESYSDTTFNFNTRVLILVGSPLAFFMHLGKGQLIARRGRERTKNVPKDIALDRAGRYGCMAVDSVYNVYNETDPVAFALNAAVDVGYSRIIKPIAIPSSNTTLLQNLTETYSRVSKMFDVSSLWSSASTNTNATAAGPEADDDTKQSAVSGVKKDNETLKATASSKTKSEEPGSEKIKSLSTTSAAKIALERMKEAAAAGRSVKPSATVVNAGPAAARPKRPGVAKRMPSERPMSSREFEIVSRAEKR